MCGNRPPQEDNSPAWGINGRRDGSEHSAGRASARQSRPGPIPVVGLKPNLQRDGQPDGVRYGSGFPKRLGEFPENTLWCTVLYAVDTSRFDT